MLPSETMIWQPEFTDKILSRKPGAVHLVELKYAIFNLLQTLTIVLKSNLLRWLTK
ncbi:transposase [Escherichia coli LAU-EC8]|nr:transposase [Escherichia coli LAU-EC8]ETE37148.1 transposase [Escherichia coli LAU-EC9]